MDTEDFQSQDTIPELAANCVNFVQRALELPLDYTQDTLPILDHYLRTAREEAPKAPLLAPLVATAGAYFAELVVRQFKGAQIHWTGSLPDCRVQFSTFFLHFNPMGIAQEIVTQNDAPGWNAHYATLEQQGQVIKQSIDQGLTLRPQDYYSFSVRYEMLDQVVAVLGALEEQRKDGPRTFGPETYAAMLGERGAREKLARGTP